MDVIDQNGDDNNEYINHRSDTAEKSYADNRTIKEESQNNDDEVSNVAK